MTNEEKDAEIASDIPSDTLKGASDGIQERKTILNGR
jgi:hypothetical protein